MTGIAASRAWKERNAAAGLCWRCGKPAAPYAHCAEHRAYQRLKYQRLRATGRCAPHRQHDPIKSSLKSFDVARCVVCGDEFGRTEIQAQTLLRKCRPCRRDYKRELEKRHAIGDVYTGPPCVYCGKPTRKASKHPEHYVCKWNAILDARERARFLEREEIRNPTTEESWLKVGRIRLAQLRNRVRAASRSPTPASQPGETSPS